HQGQGEQEEAKSQVFHTSPLNRGGNRGCVIPRACTPVSGHNLILIIAHRPSFELLDLTPLLRDRPALLIDLALLIGHAILVPLQLVPDEATGQGPHAPTNSSPGAWVPYRGANDCTTRRTYPPAPQGPFFSGTQRL